MTTFQWGKRKTDERNDKDSQVVICLDCFDWVALSPMDCKLWLINHMDKHPKKPYQIEIENDYNEPKRYD